MNTEYGRKLYSDLMALVQGEDSPFYFVDHKNSWGHFRVFNYRLASYTDFLRPSALECRGVMFHITPEGGFVGLTALGPRKFFNYKENPFTMDLDLNKVDVIMDKMDGSLMTTYLPYEGTTTRVALKSKTSLTSEQANAANALLTKPEHFSLLAFLCYMYHEEAVSISLEYTSPVYRIVVGYQEEGLTVLEGRSLMDGSEVSLDHLRYRLAEFGCSKYLVKTHPANDPEGFINSIAGMESGIEGFVVRMRDGLKMKIKTDAYCALHHCKDSVTIPRRLYEVVVNEGHDDLRAMFASDPYVLNRIDEFETKVKGIYQTIDQTAYEFHRNNSHLDRKDYAIKGQAELPKMFFSIAMDLYLGKEPNLKEFLIKKYKEFGISDEPIQDAD